jgi:hypothetical protein
LSNASSVNINKLIIKIFNKKALKMSILGLVARVQQLGSVKSWHTAFQALYLRLPN